MPAKTREEWLIALLTRLTKRVFKPADITVPKLRVSCGWPSKRALSKKNRAIGQCWSASSTDDRVPQIFITPWIEDPFEVAEILAHEMVHACLPEDAKHGAQFTAMMKQVGLEGKPTATNADESLATELKTITAALGPYPHSKINKMAGHKPQTTRLRKIQCLNCGYTSRITKKWVDVGLPTCPCGKVMEDVTPPEKDEE